MDLVCEDPRRTNLQVSARYAAYGAAGLLFFALPDKLGRRKTLLVTWAIQTVAQFVMIFVPVYEARLASFIVFGLCMLKQSVPYVWGAEIVPPGRTVVTSVAITSSDSSTMLWTGFYYLVISRDWFPLCITMTILQTIALFWAIAFIPESPQWLLTQGRVAEAIDAFNSIAKFNGVAARIPKGATFQEQVEPESVAEITNEIPVNIS